MIVPISVYVFIIGTALIIAAACLGIITAGRWLWRWAFRTYYGKGKREQ
jgi:Kef-type K+ transport system membrane component KefB